MDTPEIRERRPNKTFAIITYGFTSLLALFFIIAFGPKLIDEYMGIITGDAIDNFAGWEGIVMELTFYIFIFGFILSFKKSAVGGIIILLSSIVQMGPFLIIDGNLGSLIFGIPMVISGVLLLLKYWCSVRC